MRVSDCMMWKTFFCVFSFFIPPITFVFCIIIQRIPEWPLNQASATEENVATTFPKRRILLSCMSDEHGQELVKTFATKGPSCDKLINLT
jgi:hypothetical protein